MYLFLHVLFNIGKWPDQPQYADDFSQLYRLVSRFSMLLIKAAKAIAIKAISLLEMAWEDSTKTDRQI